MEESAVKMGASAEVCIKVSFYIGPGKMVEESAEESKFRTMDGEPGSDDRNMPGYVFQVTEPRDVKEYTDVHGLGIVMSA